VNIAVTGSIAVDHLMKFPGRFRDSLVADKLSAVSLSFLVDDLQIRRGGVGPNIAFGLAKLGVRPVLVGAAGSDFAEYASWLERHGVDVGSVKISEVHQTARFVCTTDVERNQIASFYTGAMSEARDIELGPIAERVGGLDLVVISPNDPDAMLRHTEECRQRGLAFVADPSQQMARMDGPEIRQLIEGAAYLFTNEYESALMFKKTGWTKNDVLERVGVCVTTMGPEGASVEAQGLDTILVSSAPEKNKVDPTGVGDAFRSGFLAGLSYGLDPKQCCQIGAMLATFVLETVGTQEYTFSRGEFIRRLSESYGPDEKIESALSTPARV
jgi:adenosine kinase